MIVLKVAPGDFAVLTFLTYGRCKPWKNSHSQPCLITASRHSAPFVTPPRALTRTMHQ